MSLSGWMGYYRRVYLTEAEATGAFHIDDYLLFSSACFYVVWFIHPGSCVRLGMEATYI